jgi:hypothetical protein
MLDSADIALLAAVAFLLFVAQARTRLRLRLEHAKAQKYKLYKSRDDLIYLVASGHLSEDDPLFHFYYVTCNHLIKYAHILTARKFLAALEDAENKGMDPADEKRLNEIHQGLAHKSCETHRTILEFYQVVLSILIENSFALRHLLRLRAIWAPQRRKLLAKMHLPAPQQRAFTFYRRYTNSAQRLAA